MVVVVLLWPALALAVQTYSAKVVGVTDGDTITIHRDGRRQQRVRVHGIDTPERCQPFGTRAREFTAELVFGRTVAVRDHGHDRYGRTIADVGLPGGCDLGRELVWAGLV